MPIREQAWCPYCRQVTTQETGRESRHIVVTCTKCHLTVSRTRPKKVK